MSVVVHLALMFVVVRRCSCCGYSILLTASVDVR